MVIPIYFTKTAVFITNSEFNSISKNFRTPTIKYHIEGVNSQRWNYYIFNSRGYLENS